MTDPKPAKAAYPMTQQPTIIHLPIPESLLQEKRTLLALHGFHFPGNEGSGSFKGIEFTYSYSPGTLTLTITKKPTLIPLSMIVHKLATFTGVTPKQD
jgi:hypothetical protein